MFKYIRALLLIICVLKMADQSATPPPKDTVTTRTPTPTSPVAIPAEDQNQPVIQDGAADEESKVVADESVTDATLATAAQEEAPKETTPEDKSENDKLTENTAETKGLFYISNLLNVKF